MRVQTVGGASTLQVKVQSHAHIASRRPGVPSSLSLDLETDSTMAPKTLQLRHQWHPWPRHCREMASSSSSNASFTNCLALPKNVSSSLRNGMGCSRQFQMHSRPQAFPTSHWRQVASQTGLPHCDGLAKQTSRESCCWRLISMRVASTYNAHGISSWCIHVAPWPTFPPPIHCDEDRFRKRTHLTRRRLGAFVASLRRNR
mmetsp:Transcript_54380/g.140477  ORF Transcript_54380/g.140477 Transcript_54380/m.140477 type:complete len:201 (+) Transcript_54380:2257-2859(+)